jgi:Xaa-Pro dipeptidase
MAVTDTTVRFSEEDLRAVQRQLAGLGLDGWLLYDFHGSNPVAGGVLGLPALTRRYFVLLPTRGRPVALTHRIEQQPWRGWIGGNRPYLGWESLEKELGRLLEGSGAIAMEYSPGDAVPYLDRVPAGVLELVRRSGAEPVSSGDLVTAFYSRWTAEGEASHRRAAAVLHEVAHSAFDLVGERIRSGSGVSEWEARSWIVGRLGERGLRVGVDAVVAVNANAANPHYAPSAAESSSVEVGDLLLIDLWGKEGQEAVYADQTWMAYVGDTVPDRIQALWEAVRDARDAAVLLIAERTAAGAPIAGWEVDDAARSVIAERGHGEAFIHRTGHSIDRELHGSGPNIDNLETRDTRRLMPGIGFSIEPGIYLPGEVGLRSEIDLFITADGPVVTTPGPQVELYRIAAGCA